MEKNRFDTISLDTCPEIILFHQIENLNSEVYCYVSESTHNGEIISDKDPFIIEINKKYLKICRQLTRFGVNNPTEIKEKKEIFSKETIDWFSKWVNYLHESIPHHNIYQCYEDLEEWYKDSNYDLSRWQPKTS